MYLAFLDGSGALTTYPSYATYKARGCIVDEFGVTAPFAVNDVSGFILTFAGS